MRLTLVIVIAVLAVSTCNVDALNIPGYPSSWGFNSDNSYLDQLLAYVKHLLHNLPTSVPEHEVCPPRATRFGECNRTWSMLTTEEMEAQAAEVEQQRRANNVEFSDVYQQPLRKLYQDAATQLQLEHQHSPEWASINYATGRYTAKLQEQFLLERAPTTTDIYKDSSNFFKNGYATNPPVPAKYRPWNVSTEYEDLLETDKWHDDAVFSAFRLAGTCPESISRVGSRAFSLDKCRRMLNRHFDWDEAVRRVSGMSFRRAVLTGRIFIESYPTIDGIKVEAGAAIPAFANRTYHAPLTVFVLPRGEKLIRVVAIQLGSDSDSSPVYSPSTSSFFWWNYAKLYAGNALVMASQLHYHLHNAHITGVRFSVASRRELPASHPIRLLMDYHTDHVQAITLSARINFLGSSGILKDVLTYGENGVTESTVRAYKSWAYYKMDLERETKFRGVQNLPYYPYLQDSRNYVRILRQYVDGYLRLYYCCDAQVEEDAALQAYVSYIANDIFKGEKGVPARIVTISQLVDYLTNQIWIFTGYHDAVNFPLGDYNLHHLLPLGIYIRPDQVDEQLAAQSSLQNQGYLLSVTGNAVSAAASQQIAFLLSGYKYTNVIEDSEASRSQPTAPVVEHTTEKLEQLELRLRSVNKDRERKGLLPYRYMYPSQMTGSVSI